MASFDSGSTARLGLYVAGLAVVLVTIFLLGRAANDDANPVASVGEAAAGGNEVAGQSASSPAGTSATRQSADADSGDETGNEDDAGGANAAAEIDGRRIPIAVPPEYADLLERDDGLAAFHRALELEPRDALWAQRLEDFFRDHFASTLDPNEIQVGTIECRTRSCEMLAVGYGDEASRDWMRSMTMLFEDEERLKALAEGEGTAGCSIGDIAPGIVSLSCTLQRVDPDAAPAAPEPEQLFSLDTPYPEGTTFERIGVPELLAPAIETNREMYELHRRLESEAIDYGWAGYVEPIISDYLAGLNADAISVVAVVCRSTLCEVQMSATDDLAFIEWIPALLEFQRLDSHDLITANFDGTDGDSGEPGGLVWFLQRNPNN